MNRDKVLLRAAYGLLKQQHESPYVINLLEQTEFYDGTDCDGHCLMDDIASQLGIEEY